VHSPEARPPSLHARPPFRPSCRTPSPSTVWSTRVYFLINAQKERSAVTLFIKSEPNNTSFSPQSRSTSRICSGYLNVCSTRNLARLDKLVDRDEWDAPPQRVNAEYNILMNTLTFFTEFLQPPYFDPQADDAVNYGAIALKNVRTEMSLQVLAYNMKRIIKIFGVKPLIAAIAA
jgi:Peptidase family M13